MDETGKKHSGLMRGSTTTRGTQMQNPERRERQTNSGEGHQEDRRRRPGDDKMSTDRIRREDLAGEDIPDSSLAEEESSADSPTVLNSGNLLSLTRFSLLCAGTPYPHTQEKELAERRTVEIRPYREKVLTTSVARTPMPQTQQV